MERAQQDTIGAMKKLILNNGRQIPVSSRRRESLLSRLREKGVI